MKPAVQPRRAFAVAPDLIAPGGELEVWFTDPPGAVVQMPSPMVGTAAMARWLVGEARERLYRRFPDASQFYFLVDLSVMTSRDPALRSIIGEASKEMKSKIARAIIVPSESANVVFLKSLEVAVLLLHGFGVNLEIYRSSAQAMASMKLSPARRES